MWFIIRKAKPEIFYDSDTCETKCYLCRKTEENPIELMIHLQVDFFQLNDGKDWDICGRWKHVQLSPFYPIFRTGVEITQGDEKQPEYSFASTACSMTILLHCIVLGYLEITVLQMDSEIFFLMLQNNCLNNIKILLFDF